MAASPDRRFTIVDGMVLVAATAIGCASLSVWSREYFRYETGGMNLALHALKRIWIYLQLTLPFGFSWTVALTLLRLRRPRPSRRRLARRPGAVACFAVCAVLAIRLLCISAGFVTFLIDWNLDWGPDWPPLNGILNDLKMIPYSLASSNDEAGLAVAVAWIALVLGGHWRPEPTWLDRAGRLLGAFWIGIIPFSSWVAHDHIGFFY